jgi:hypothetical protein
LFSSDRNLQNNAFPHFQNLNEKPVDWAYEVWGGFVAMLRNKDSHNRAIAFYIVPYLRL